MDSNSLAILIKDFDPTRGGGETFAVRLALALRRSGLRPDIIARSVAPDLKDSFPCHLLANGRGLARQAFFDHSARRFLSERPYACTLALTQVAGCDIYRAGGGWIRHWSRIRYPGRSGRLLSRLSISHQSQIGLEDRIMKDSRLQAIVVNSELAASQCHEYYPGSTVPVHLIHNPIPESFRFTEAPDLMERTRIADAFAVRCRPQFWIFSGNNFERKGLQELLEVMENQDHREQIFLGVLGRGNLARAAALVGRRHLSGQVFFAGHQRDMARFYRAADLLVLPTRYDPCSNVCLEALATGLPVITTDQNGASMFLKSGGGWSIPVATMKDDLARAMTEFLNCGDITSLRHKARQSVESLTEERIVKLWLERIEEVCRKKSP